MVKIAGGKTGSVNRLKKEMEKSSGDRTWIKYLKSGEDLTVRFLTEPDEWYAYREHYSPDGAGFFPCVGKDSDCPGCNSDVEKVQRASRRYLANVLDVEAGQVVPLKLPLDLANRLVARYERNNDTLINRDYTLHRMGKGLDTTYDVTPEDKTEIDVTRYDLHDLEEALVYMFEDAFDLDGDEPPAKSSSDKKKEQAKALLDDDDDLDTDDVPSEPSTPAAEEEDEGYLTEEQALAMDKDDLVELAKQVGAEVDGRWKKERLVSAIFDAAE